MTRSRRGGAEMPADSFVDVLIVGAGPAGVTCAEELRTRGFEGSVLVAGREPDPPYSRPVVSKEYLRGALPREQALLRPASYWEERGIDLLTRVSVMKLDAGARTARLSDKREIAFGRALLATGANVRRLRVDGAQLDGIHHLRALGNADALRGDAEGAGHAVLVGGSFVACEVAASLTEMGLACTLVMAEELPLATAFGRRAGEFFARVLRERGIELVCADPLERFEPAPQEDGRARVAAVVTATGRVLPAALVVMGTGAVPDVMLARAAGLDLGGSGGIRCSSRLETSAPGIWAAGDCCEYDSELHGRRLRIEHWEAAKAQGRFVARSMLGDPRAFAEVPYFWADLAGWCRLEYVGAAADWDQEVVRGSPADGRFSIFYLQEGRLAGALTVGRSEDLEEAVRLLEGRVPLGRRVDALGDVDTALSSL